MTNGHGEQKTKSQSGTFAHVKNLVSSEPCNKSAETGLGTKTSSIFLAGRASKCAGFVLPPNQTEIVVLRNLA